SADLRSDLDLRSSVSIAAAQLEYSRSRFAPPLSSFPQPTTSFSSLRAGINMAHQPVISISSNSASPTDSVDDPSFPLSFLLSSNPSPSDNSRLVPNSKLPRPIELKEFADLRSHEGKRFCKKRRGNASIIFSLFIR
ncbi:hypothetical protein PTTG_30685, partial [Puccinia triticina 1-1 BBBD Race 1]